LCHDRFFFRAFLLRREGFLAGVALSCGSALRSVAAQSLHDKNPHHKKLRPPKRRH